MPLPGQIVDPCAVKFCTRKHIKDRSMVKFPTDKKQRQLWTFALTDKLVKKKKLLICDHHFEAGELVDDEPGYKKTVNNEVAPSKHLNVYGRLNFDDDAAPLLIPPKEVKIEIPDLTEVGINGNLLLPQLDVMRPEFIGYATNLVPDSGGYQAHCIVNSCPFSEVQFRFINHYLFPSDPIKAAEWARLCQYEEDSRPESLRRVCCYHFPEGSFYSIDFFAKRNIPSPNQKIIKPNSYPTLFMDPVKNQKLWERWVKFSTKWINITDPRKPRKFNKQSDLYGSAEFTEPVEVLIEDQATKNPDEDPEVDEDQLKELYTQSCVNFNLRSRKSKTEYNAEKIQFLEEKISSLEEMCLNQKLLLAKFYSIAGNPSNN